jgi:maleylacetoacetate isomerase
LADFAGFVKRTRATLSIKCNPNCYIKALVAPFLPSPQTITLTAVRIGSQTSMVRLYSFPTSSASYRARIALHFKGVKFETVTVDIYGGEQHRPDYRRRYPHGRVPALELDDGTVIGQSLAIIDYLEQAYPTPRLYPADPVVRARALAIALTVAADVHPLNNTAVLGFLRDEMGQDQAARDKWYVHWVRNGLAAIEQMIDGSPYCVGSEPTVADVCLVPQVLNARRNKVDISDLRKLLAADENSRRLPAFAAAAPERQPTGV